MSLTEFTIKNKAKLVLRAIYRLKLSKRIYIFPLLFILIALLCVNIGTSTTIFIFSVIFATIIIAHTLLKLSATPIPDSKINFYLDKKYKPFVSIHVACKNEPAEIVNETIEALTKLDYDNYEVILIHSNNQDKNNWMKIKKYVESCGDNYIFVHLDTVSGFKAGALNYLNENHMSKSADVVAIVDCDYIVRPDFLTKTVGYFNDPKVGIVQAPQDYFNKNSYNIGLFYEYKSFFTLVMHQAQRFNLVNFTGTMGLIRASLLKDNDLKWNEWCITEDTEAGTHINSIGYRGVYVDESLGSGLMPYNYNSLARQRQRWVYGNSQIIGKDLYYVMINKAFNILQKISFIAQLVTWMHFEIVIALMYLLTTLLNLSGVHNDLLLASNNVLAISLIISLIGNLIYFIFGLRKETSIINRLKAFLVHYGLIYIMSSGWLLYVIGYKLGFNVTSKKISGDKFNVNQLLLELSTSIVLLVILLIKVYSNNITAIDLAAIGLFLIAEISGVIYLNRSFIKEKE